MGSQNISKINLRLTLPTRVVSGIVSCMNFDYTLDIPPIADTIAADDYVPDEQEYGCECEIDWKCGFCRENGYSHSRLDAFGLGPDADLEAEAARYLGEFR